MVSKEAAAGTHTAPGTNDRQAPRGSRVIGAFTGLVVAGFALGVGQLAAGVVGEPASPVLAVGQTAIDLSPQWLRSFAIRTFGPNDKTVLIGGVLLMLAIASALLGVATVRLAW